MTQTEIVFPQTANLDRVRSKIAGYVLDFLGILNHGDTFRMAELTDYVKRRDGIAPDSAGRILRDMRQKGLIGYEVVNRAESLYRFTGSPQQIKER